MKSGAILSTSIVALLLGTAGFAGAQNGRARGHEDGGPHGQRHESAHPSQAQHGNRGNGPEHHYQQPRESHEAYQRGPERHVYGAHGPVEYRQVRRDDRDLVTFGKTSGNVNARMTGTVSIVAGTIAADTTGIAFPTIASAPISAADTGSASTRFRSS